jgi:biopolymer transport protein ExbD
VAILNKKSKISDEIPSASMADIAFLLLIFFLVTTVFPKDRGLPIVLPEEQEEVEISQRNILHITINPDGSVGVRRGDSQNESFHRPHQIQQVWRTEVSQNPNLIAGVRTHPEAAHRYMVQVLDALQMANAERISLQMGEG